MKTRILAAIILLPLLLLCLFVLPTVCTAILVSAMAALAAYELLWGTGMVRYVRLVCSTSVMAGLFVFWCYLGMDYVTALLGMLIFVSLLFSEVLLSKGKLPFRVIAVCLFGGLAIPFLLAALLRILDGSNGRYLIAAPFIMAFMSDSGAYFAGKFFGKHKLAPTISPNKTVEGMVGGIVISIVGMLLYGLVLQIAFAFDVDYLMAVLYGFLGSVAGVFGDLSFSAIKRQTGIKDYGNLIPGHGGVLDRFDSMTLVAPLTEALLLLLPMAVK